MLRGATAVLDMTGYSGIVEYEPGEFVFTARAGTSLRQLRDVLAAEGQYLPFDPPLLDAEATIGGTVAAGLSGPGRLRFGGIRDFLIGVSLIDGQGTLIRGGGKVVKNAAGFDLPKLMVGSLGRLGVLTELTFKVFPRPSHRVTLRLECQNLADSIRVMCQLAGGPWECEVIDLEPPGGLVLRLAGEEDAITSRANGSFSRPIVAARSSRNRRRTGARSTGLTGRQTACWSRRRSPPNASRRSIGPWQPPMPGDVTASRETWPGSPGRQVGLSTHWIRRCSTVGLSGLVIRGETERLRLGVDPARPFVDRIKRALDPDGRFGAL